MLDIPKNSIFFISQFTPIKFLCPQDSAIIVRIHDLFPLTHPEFFRFKQKLIFRFGLKTIDSKMYFWANSEFTRAEFISKYPQHESRTKLVECQIDTFLNSKRCDQCKICKGWELENTNYALIVGTIEPRKNHLPIIELWNTENIRSEQKLIIVGKQGWKSRKIIRQIIKAEHTKKVVWMNDACDNALHQLYLNATLFLAPSKIEGFDLPFFEALQYGVNVLASNIEVHKISNPPQNLILIDRFDARSVKNALKSFPGFSKPEVSNLIESTNRERKRLNRKIANHLNDIKRGMIGEKP